MMSILMLGLISAGGGVGVATFSQDQQSGLTQTTGGAGLREAVTIENVEFFDVSSFLIIDVTVRNTGSVNITIGNIYFDGELQEFLFFTGDDDDNLAPGESVTIGFDLFEFIEKGSVHIVKVTTEGGGVTTTTATSPQTSLDTGFTSP